MEVRPASISRAGLLILGGGLLIGLLAGLLLFVGLPGQWPWLTTAGVGSGPIATPAPAAVAGAPAPAFTLSDLAGKPVALPALRGQVVLLNFWATWCGPCQLEMPTIQRAYDKYKGQGLMVLAVNLSEPAADVQTYTGNLKLSFTVLLDPGDSVSTLYRVRGYPTSFFVDRNGMVAAEQVGMMSEDQLAQYLSKLGLGG